VRSHQYPLINTAEYICFALRWTVTMNSIRQIQELNKRELEAGM